MRIDYKTMYANVFLVITCTEVYYKKYKHWLKYAINPITFDLGIN